MNRRTVLGGLCCALNLQNCRLLCALCLLPAEAEALGALRIIAAALGKARLLHLNLSDNALGEKGIRAAAAAFSQQVRCSGWGGVRCANSCCAKLSFLARSEDTLCRIAYLLALTARMPARPAGEPGKHRLPERRLLGARLRGAGRADGQHGAPAPPAPVQQHERLRGGGLHCTVSWRGVGGRSSWRAQSLVHSCYTR